jgi:hypothetical protein
MSDLFAVKNPFSEIKRSEIEPPEGTIIESPFEPDPRLLAKAPDCDPCIADDLIRIQYENLYRVNGENLLRVGAAASCAPTGSPVEPEPEFTESIQAPPIIETKSSPPNKIASDGLGGFRLDMNPPETCEPIKRVDRIRRDDDKVPVFSVTMNDIDQAIEFHMKNNIDPTVEENGGEAVKVPIIYASPERWKAVRRDGYLRDRRGQIQYPLIVYSRTNLAKNEEIPRPNRLLDYQIPVAFSSKNRYDKFSVLNSIRPVKEIHNIIFPDHVVLTYEVKVWAEYVQQISEIAEAFNWASEEYWGDKRETKIRRVWRTNVSDISTPIEVTSGEDRFVTADFTLTTFAHLLPKSHANRMTTQKEITPRKAIFNFEIDTARTVYPSAEQSNPLPVKSSIDPNDPDGAIKAAVAPASVEMQTFIAINNEVEGSLIIASDPDDNFVVNFPNTSLLPTPCHLIGTFRESDKFNLIINNLENLINLI